MRILLTIALIIFISFSGTAQILRKTIPSPPTGFQFVFKLGTNSDPGAYYPPHINSLSLGTGTSAMTPSPTNPATCTFTEFGDGNFSFNESISHTYPSAALVYPLSYKTTGVYDDDPRPPRHRIDMLVAPMLSGSGGSALTAKLTMPPVLDIAKSVGVMANINSVLARDTMIFIVTYKLQLNADLNSYIKFSYNNIDAFDIVDINATMADGGLSMPFVRPYFGEGVTVERKIAGGYNQSLRISKLLIDSLEHHVFITMIPRKDLSRESVPAIKTKSGVEVIDIPNLTANVLAELFDGTNVKKDEDSKQYPVADKSHDPNYIEMYPKCLSLPKKEEKIRFHVHCQNIGKGNAKEVKIMVGLPGGIKTSDIDLSSVKDKAPFGIKGVWDYSNADSLIVSFDLSAFETGTTTHSPHTLNGSNTSPLYLSDTKTMADIWFTLKTNTTVPNMLSSAANIYFRNLSDGSWNEAVATNTDFVQYSECCNCKSKEQGCGCSKKKSRFWRWLFCKKC